MRKQGFGRKKQVSRAELLAGYFRGEGSSTTEDSAINWGERQGEGRGGGRMNEAGSTKLGQAEGWMPLKGI
jgi:hypothetical protein